MINNLDNGDLRVFVVTARRSSFAGAAHDLGMSPAYVSKRIGILEKALGVRLFHRTTRRVVITEEGTWIYARAQAILQSLDNLLDEVSDLSSMPRGYLRISSSFGFGRKMVAPVIAQLSRNFPSLQIRFEVFDRLVDIVGEGFDLDVRVGDQVAPHLIAKQLMKNHRILCASPAYLKRHGMPQKTQELSHHNCLAVKERDHPFGVWRLSNGRDESVIKANGVLSSNNGEIALQWAIQGVGIILRSLWDVQPHIDSGELTQVLPEYRQEANVWAVYPQRLASSAKVRVCVEALQRHLATATGQKS